MSFGLLPSEYLAMLNEVYAEFRSDDMSIRRAITCCVFANHLPDILVEHYQNGPAKLHGCTTLDAYRGYIAGTGRCPDTKLIRDLCDYGKHGTKLGRKTPPVQVARSEVKPTLVLDTTSLLAGAPNHQRAVKIVVELFDGSQLFFDGLISIVIGFWNDLFVSDAL
jgi:hypothetical protein